MTIRRSLRVLLIILLVLAGIAWGSWSLVQARLADLGIERIEFSGTDLGWNRIAFRSVELVWSGNGRSLSLEAADPRLTLDWLDWQLDTLVTGPTRITQAGSLQPPSSSSPSPAPTSPTGRGANALELTLPDTMPFWLPRHLEIESLQASFPCQGSRCRFQGQLEFHREDERARAQVDATLARDDHTLAIQGDVRLGSGARAGTITGGEVRISGIRPWLPGSMAAELERLVPASATLRFSPGGEPTPGQWPMNVALTSEGGAGPAFEGEVVLHTGDPWRLDITRGRLTAALERWTQSGWLLKDLRADLPVTGVVAPSDARLTLASGATVRVRHMDAFGWDTLMWLDGVALSAGGLVVRLDDGQFSAEGPLALSAEELRYPGLVTQAWEMVANVRWRQALIADGELGNAAGAVMPFQVERDAGGALEADLSMVLTPDDEANHLAQTLAAWPESLTLDKGRVDVAANLAMPPQGSPDISGEILFDQASGLHRTMAWQELSGQVRGRWQGDRLSVSTESLELASLNPGVPIGPIRLGGDYEADTGAPGQGRLTLTEASAGFAGGSLSIPETTTWNLGEMPLRVPVDVRGMQLSALMNLYPTEGLAGEGTLEGRLPVVVGPEGVRIDDGRITALPPGGRLQLPADKLRGMVQGNAAMALVARAMENFHYRLLESGINYGEDGTLLLDLKLRGSSPEVDSDRPVVLNINLQEDIPALMTSLQLSGRVNEAVKERVRERLMQEGVETQ
ncbi:YdbH domain-containing protein [Marinobacter sp. LN3S78]|uniref:YdbH domain-containing protein n=1 Tax=Marinobacter sp. LN3S78 TaxID=3382300 RepID=UPI00387AA880